eukprot:TRINITY_DN16043_c0_g1_i1.p1 TRINITY_DN16043_c0_g1~~TRINITY_DN16043_c0_g1_i1.p1  ORF type:complete len:132 (+),score=30.61 TRINITY_DN16043_c0_g1_i1:79-474(+)
MKNVVIFKFKRDKFVNNGENQLVIFTGKVDEAPPKEKASKKFNDEEGKKLMEEVIKELQDAKDSSLEEKRVLCKKLILKWHPDKNPDNVELATGLSFVNSFDRNIQDYPRILRKMRSKSSRKSKRMGKRSP